MGFSETFPYTATQCLTPNKYETLVPKGTYDEATLLQGIILGVFRVKKQATELGVAVMT